MSSKLKPLRFAKEDHPTKEDIRKLIETSHDVGREIENLVEPVNEEKASVICEKESLKYFLGDQSMCKVYFGTEIFKKTGDGVYLFFIFLMVCFFLFLVFGLVSIYTMVNNFNGGYDDSENEYNFLTKLTYGNFEQYKTVNFDVLKEYFSKYITHQESQNSVKEMNGTEVVVMKNSSGNLNN
jgi:hypothetical protein